MILKLALALAVVGLGLSIGGVAMGATITGINLIEIWTEWKYQENCEFCLTGEP